jgi:hypothetical protein
VWPVIEVNGAESVSALCLPKLVINPSMQHSILRWIHLVFGIPIIGYIYSPIHELSNYAPVVRYVAVPAIFVSGLWMWKGQALLRSLSQRHP